MHEEQGSRFAIARWLLTAISLCLLLTVPASADAAKLSSPSKLAQDYDSRVAVAGDDLWLAILGSDRRGHFRIEVHRLSGGSWSTIPGRLPTLYEKGLQFAALTPVSGPTVPCVGDSPRDQARIRCFRDGAWQKLEIDPALAGMAVTGLKADGPVLTASFTRWNPDGSSTVAVGQASGATISPAGPPLELAWRVLSSLGSQTVDYPPGAIDLSLETWTGPAPWALALTSLDSGSWADFKPLPVDRTGRQESGPVRFDGGLYFPATQALPGGGPVSHWRTDLYRENSDSWARVTGKQVGTATGANSGGAYPVGDRVWFVWARIWFTGKALKSRLLAARVSLDGQTFDRRIVLIPNRADQNYQRPQVISYRGRPVFLYQSSATGKWRATLDFSHR